MKALQNLIGNSTYMVTDNVSNRFNFFGLIEVTSEFVQESKHVVEWSITEDLPKHVQRALDVMAENSVVMDDFTGIVTIYTAEEAYYLLTW